MIESTLVISLYLGLSVIPQIIYFEISLLFGDRTRRHIILESIAFAFVNAVAMMAFWWNHGSDAEFGELNIIFLSPFIILFYVLTGLPIGVLYKLMRKTFVQKLKERN